MGRNKRVVWCPRRVWTVERKAEPADKTGDRTSFSRDKLTERKRLITGLCAKSGRKID